MMSPLTRGTAGKYSSYKKRKFEKTLKKLDLLISGINQLSLNKGDKVKLLNKCKELINSK